VALLNFVRALFVTAACVVALAVCATAAQAQVVEPPAGDVIVAPDPLPAPEPSPTPEAPPTPEPTPPPEQQPVDQAPPQEPADQAPQQPADPPPAERQASTGTSAQRSDAPRDAALPSSHATPPPGVPNDQLTAPEQLPAGGAGEDWAWTDEGDAYIFGSGGSSDGTVRGALVTFSGYGSIASAAAGASGLDSRSQAARATARARADGSAVAVTAGGTGKSLFASLFGGGSGGGGAVLLTITLLGILSAYRLVPPDWDRAFRTSTATWRPSAYAPPIEHPG
jgi:outer membrane biosynthesis protein TonB